MTPRTPSLGARLTGMARAYPHRIPMLCAATLLLSTIFTLASAESERPAAATRWLRTELYVSLREGVRPNATPAAWEAFLDNELSPRFPDGFVVLDAYGQWTGTGGGQLDRTRSKVIVLIHADTPERRADLDAVRVAWKAATGHASVLRSIQPVEVSL